ncbi:MAG: hypothetical protein M3Y76_00700, partial [Chloroflexota bacterium]|nr:hypothetical protein [Chloroflexota bacterium]
MSVTSFLTGSSLHQYTPEGSIHSFFGGFDIYASEPLTPSCFLFKQGNKHHHSCSHRSRVPYRE